MGVCAGAQQSRYFGLFQCLFDRYRERTGKRIFDFSDVNYDQYLFQRSTVDAEFMTVAESTQINMYVHYEHVFIKKKQHITYNELNDQ